MCSAAFGGTLGRKVPHVPFGGEDRSHDRQTGVGQDPLPFVHSSEEYGPILLRDPAALRTTLGLDNAFIFLLFLYEGPRLLHNRPKDSGSLGTATETPRVSHDR